MMFYPECRLDNQLWRIRFNWIFFVMLGSLYAISYTSISASFHQFVTNPTLLEIKKINNTAIQPGLGLSEEFYSWIITVFNFGALIGAIGTGIVVKVIPFWHTIMTILVCHTAGYILYAISYGKTIMVLSKFLSGIFIGGEVTLSLSYFAISADEYNKILKKRNCKTQPNITRALFAWHNVGTGIGYILGPGAAALIAQFDIDQFHTIAWFNVAIGVLLGLLEVMMFSDNMYACNHWKRPFCFSAFSKRKFNFTKLDVFILIFLITCRGVLSFRFGVYETIYNPVLSDYFGFDERTASYFFFALVISQITGTVLLMILQLLKMSDRNTAILGLIMSIVSCALLADWQSIPHDKCIDFSPFHNPQLTDKNLSQMKESLYTTPNNDIKNYISKSGILNCTAYNSVGYKNCTMDQKHVYEDNNITYSSYNCTLAKDQLHYNCTINNINLMEYEFAGIESLYLLDDTMYNRMMIQCESVTIEGQQCHWIPNSIVTQRYCRDCQPICRNPQYSLNFIQFCLGAAILMLSIPVAWIPVASLVSQRVNENMQGIMMGVVVALTAIGRIISPLWLDATYEAVGKRTFLAMSIMIISHLVYLVIFIALYHQFKPKDKFEFKSLPHEQSSSSSSSASSDESSD